MTLAAPLNLLWLIPAFGAIIAVYLLRRPRRNVVVPSTLFWRMLPEQAVRATRVQRFTPETLFLQMLLALLLIGAAAQTQVRRAVPVGRVWAVILDDSASMNAVSPSGARLDDAKESARHFLSGLPTGDSVCVIATGGGARMVQALSPHPSDAQAALDRIPATDARGDIAGAVALAASVEKRAEASGRVGGMELFSDGAWPSQRDGSIAATADGIPLHWTTVGASDDQNIGITRLAVQRDPAEPGQRLQVYVAVQSHMQDAQSVPLEISIAGRRVDGRELAPAPDGSASAVFSVSAPPRSADLTASISPSHDALPDDNFAYAVLPAAGSTRVLLVSDGDPPLERVLGLLPGVQVDRMGGAAFLKSGAPGGYGLTILDGVAPPAGGSVPGNLLVWGGAGPDFAASSTSDPGIAMPVVDWDQSHPTMRFIDFESFGDLRAPAWQSVGSWQPLIETQAGIIAAASDAGGRRALWLSFTPQSSGFARQTAFPIFVSNAVGWLTQEAGQEEVAGTPLALAPVAGGWSVAGPDNSGASGFCGGDGTPCDFTRTDRAGIYTAVGGGRRILFARNVDPAATDLQPVSHNFGAATELSRAVSGGDARTRPGWSNLADWVAGLCLLMLVVEWWVYHGPRRLAKRAS